MKYLLDTALWVNGVLMPEAIPLRIRRLLEDEDIKGLCSVSLLETAILHRIGRLALNGSLTDFFAAGLSSDVRILELTPAVAARTNELSLTFQGDPFDRTIVATADVQKLTLITSDAGIRNARACDVEYYPFKIRNRSRHAKSS